jgi:capsid portal protein
VWEIAREGEEIVAIYPLPGHTLRAVKPDPQNPDGPRVYVQVRGDRRVYFKEFGERRGVDSATGREAAGGDANEVLILQHYSERTPYYGIPPWVSGVPPIAEFAAIREYNVSWFSSGGTGDRHMHVKAKDLTVAKQLADSILHQMQEAKGVGHTTTISHGTEDTEVEVQLMSPEVGKREGQFRDRREDLAIEILVAHQVPPYRVGWALMGSLGGSTARETLDAYRYGVIEPVQEDVEALLNATIFSPEGGGFPLSGYRFRFRDPDWSELEMELRLATEAVDHAMATPNEGRELLGLPRGDDPALDRYYYSGQPVSAGGDVREAQHVLREFKQALEAVVQAERERAQKRRWPR